MTVPPNLGTHSLPAHVDLSVATPAAIGVLTVHALASMPVLDPHALIAALPFATHTLVVHPDAGAVVPNIYDGGYYDSGFYDIGSGGASLPQLGLATAGAIPPLT